VNEIFLAVPLPSSVPFIRVSSLLTIPIGQDQIQLRGWLQPVDVTLMRC
jgi:hypothetical protein